jgi:hypothetical protein
VKSVRRIAATVLAAFALLLSTAVNPYPAQAQGDCPYNSYCIWVDTNFTWPYCHWQSNDGNYRNDWCESSGGNEHLAANAATSYHNNGIPAEFDSIRSFKEAWGSGDLTWYVPRGERGDSARSFENDDAESHYWYNG